MYFQEVYSQSLPGSDILIMESNSSYFQYKLKDDLIKWQKCT